jgi:hypothetical protein
MFGKKTEPNEFDQRDAELETEDVEIKAIVARAVQLDAALQPAVVLRAHAALSRVQSNPSIFARTSTAEMDALKKAVVEAEDTEAKATAEIAAHNAKHSDLPARRQALHEAEQALAIDRAQAVYLVHGAELLEALNHAAECEQKVYQDLRNAPPDAGLVPLTFPAGIFRSVMSPYGQQQSIFRDDFLRTVAMAYPEMLRALPDDLATQLHAEVEAWRAKGTGTIYFAARPTWLMAGGWHAGGVKRADELGLLCGRIRRELHDLV